jgi:hypothetical protein
MIPPSSMAANRRSNSGTLRNLGSIASRADPAAVAFVFRIRSTTIGGFAMMRIMADLFAKPRRL